MKKLLMFLFTILLGSTASLIVCEEKGASRESSRDAYELLDKLAKRFLVILEQQITESHTAQQVYDESMNALQNGRKPEDISDPKLRVMFQARMIALERFAKKHNLYNRAIIF